jgi:hypothetical protein
MKYAIKVLSEYKKYYKNKLKNTSASEFKTECTVKLAELTKAIKILKEVKQ